VKDVARGQSRRKSGTRPACDGVAPIKIILIGNTYCLRIMPSSHGRNTGWLRNLYVAYDVFRVVLVTLRIRDLPSNFMKNADSRTVRGRSR